MAEKYVGLSTTVWAIVGASESVFLGVLVFGVTHPAASSLRAEC